MVLEYQSLLSAKLKRTDAAIEEYRSQIDTRKAENYGFASMAAVPYSHVVAKMLRSKHPKGTYIELAPNHKDIVCGFLQLMKFKLSDSASSPDLGQYEQVGCRTGPQTFDRHNVAGYCLLFQHCSFACHFIPRQSGRGMYLQTVI